MPNTTKDGSMVGMDQCRISSIESNISPLDHNTHLSCEGSSGGPEGECGGMSSSSSSRAPPLLYTQRSRGSHSSSSCGGQEDCILTEAEPLLPVSFTQDSKKASAHVNKLHFDLYDQHVEDHCVETSEVEEDDEDGERKTQNVQEKENLVEPTSAEPIIQPNDLENIRGKINGVVGTHQKGSNDTVCTSSSSASRTSNKSSKVPKQPGKHKNKRLRHLSTDTDDTSDISVTLEPPDGGWGWVVVVASFVVNLIADGVTFSFGVFFTEFTEYFQESESTTAWIGSLLAAMPLLSGPIASWLTDRYGCRNVTIVGGLLAAFGFFLSSYTTSIYVLMITFGVITGFGLSLCYVAAVVIVAYYFERRRSFATGLSVCGGGIGTFLVAPLSQHLISSYGWQRTTLILAGAFLCLCACGLVMKDLEWTKKKNKSSNNNNSNNHTLSHHNCGNHFSCSTNHQDSDKSILARKGNRRCNSAICIPTFVQEQERRERRQRYYSCNQDSGNEDGPQSTQPPKTGKECVDRSSPGGKYKRNVRKVSHNRELDYDFHFPCPTPGGEKSYLFPSNALLVNSVCDDGQQCSQPCSEGCTQSTTNNLNSPVRCDVSEHLIQYPDLNIIPEEKDTRSNIHGHVSEANNCSLVNCNGEIDIAHINNMHNRPPNSSILASSPLLAPASTIISTGDEINIGGTESSDSCSNNELCTNFQYNNNSNGKLCGLDASSGLVEIQGLGKTTNNNCISNHCHHHHYNNHLHHHIQSSNNDSNNPSINNNNSYNNTINNGVVRNNSNNSGNHILQNNNNSTSSFTTTTMLASAPNGIPTIIIPSAQQSKQSVNNVKIDMINSMRYRSVMHRHSLTYRGAVLNLKRYRLRPASSCPDIISVATSTDGRGSFEFMTLVGDACRWINGVCEWENLMNTRFFLFILSNLLLYTWYDVPYMYLQTAAVRHGYSDTYSSYLISSIGLSNVVGNILLGYLGDKKWASATIVYGVCMIICGATTVFMPYLMETSYWSLFTICGLFGLTIAANYALTSVILVQVVSLERFANAYGLLLLVQGIGNLVGPPIAGVISDMTGTNTWSFLVAGVGIFASSFFVLAPIFQRDIESENSVNETVHGGRGHSDAV